MASEGESKLPKSKRRSLLPAFQKAGTPKPSTCVPSAAGVPIKKLGIGERVVISGVKFGILKYYGEIPLASGIWCGIELDEPDGKHDGEVDGRRYFTCPPHHGIFAPVEKVDAVEYIHEDKEQEIQVSPVHQPVPLLRSDEATFVPSFVKKTDIEESSVPAKRCLPQLSSKSGIASRLPSVSSKNEQKQTPRKLTNSQANELSSPEHISQVTKISSGISYIKTKQQTRPESEELDIEATEIVRKPTKSSAIPGLSRLPVFGKNESSSLLKSTRTIKSDVSAQSSSQTADGKILNTTYRISGDQSNGEDSFSDGVKLQLKADRRQYLNLTFDAENGFSPNNLPDVVSSASPSPESSIQLIDQTERSFAAYANENSNVDVVDASSLNSTYLLQDTDENLQDYLLTQTSKYAPANVDLTTSTPLVQDKVNLTSEIGESFRQRHGSGGSRVPILPHPGIRELFSKLPGAAMQNESCYKMESEIDLCNSDQNQIADDTFYVPDSVGYESDVYSCSIQDGQAAEKTYVVDKGITEIPMPLEEMEFIEKLQQEEFIEELLGGMTESFVQNLEQGLDKTKGMTDSGISDKSVTESVNSSKLTDSFIMKEGSFDTLLHGSMSQKPAAFGVDSAVSAYAVDTSEKTEYATSMTDSGISKSMTESGLVGMSDALRAGVLVKKKPMIDSGISDEFMSSSQQIDFEEHRLDSDLRAGHVKQERPVSLISTTSADTGYCPDSDTGTLTTNSPLDWTEIQTDDYEKPTEYTELFEHIAKADEVLTMGQILTVEGDLDVETLQETDRQTDGETDEENREDVDSACVVKSEIRGDGNLQEDRISCDTTLVEEHQAEMRDKTLPAVKESENVTSALNGTFDVSSESSSLSVSNGSVIEREPIPSDKHTDSSQSEHVEKVNKINNSKNQKPSANVGYVEVVHDSVKDKNTESKKTSNVKKKTPEKIEHKKINLSKVRSSLADYIKAPPAKPPEDKENEAKNKKNILNKRLGDNKKSTAGKSSEKEAEKKENNSENKHNRIVVEKEIPKIKKSTPKSKWGNIMSKIEASKEIPYKPKPKSEIKSKLDIFNISNTSTHNTSRKEKESQKESKPRSKLIQTPKPDFSNVKSKLNITPVVNLKRELSPADAKKKNSSKSGKCQSVGNLSETANSAVSSARTSHTDLSENVSDSSPQRSKSQTPRNSLSQVRSKHPSAASSCSDVSQVSVKAQNEKNNKKGDKQRADKSKRFSDVKSSIPPPNRSQPTKTTKSSYLKSSHQPDLVSNSLQPNVSEISRLETLCESRTKELNYIKMQLKSNTQAFDAMSCLVRYLTEQLDAFSCPALSEKLKKVEKELTDVKSDCDELKQQQEKLEKVICELKEQHEDELKTQKQSLEQQHCESIRQMQLHHEQVVATIKECHSENISDTRADHQRALDIMRLSHLEEIESLRTKHDHQMEELHKQHRSKVEDMTNRFESIKLALGEKVEMMKAECEENRKRAKMSEEALLRDSDVRVQLALQPYENLPKEIESLKTVIEMRNEEIQKLRLKNMELEKHLEELPIAQERIASYQQKIENLEAIVNIKTDNEKQLHGRYQHLMKRCEKESKTNKRLSMDYEELMWKLVQESGSPENLIHRQISRSPTSSRTSSPDTKNKGHSPAHSDSDESARHSRRSREDLENRLKRRSGTFIVVPKRYPSSASPKPKRPSSECFESSSPRSSGMSCSDTSFQSAAELSSLDISLQSMPDLSRSQTVSPIILSQETSEKIVSQPAADDAAFEDNVCENISKSSEENTGLETVSNKAEDSESCKCEQQTLRDDDETVSSDERTARHRHVQESDV